MYIAQFSLKIFSSSSNSLYEGKWFCFERGKGYLHRDGTWHNKATGDLLSFTNGYFDTKQEIEDLLNKLAN